MAKYAVMSGHPERVTNLIVASSVADCPLDEGEFVYPCGDDSVQIGWALDPVGGWYDPQNPPADMGTWDDLNNHEP